MENKFKITLFLEKLHYFSTLALVFSFPFSIYIVKIVIFLWLFTWLLQLKKSLFTKPTNKLYLLSIVVFFILHLISYWYSENGEESLKNTFKLIYFLIFPFIILFNSSLYKKNFKNILSFFVLGNITVSLICLINAFYNSFNFSEGKIIFQASVEKQLPFFQSISDTGNYFFYDSFSLFQHPSYFAMFVVFSILILFFLKINNNNNNEDKNKLVKLLSNKYILPTLIIFLILIVFLLSSKINVFAIFIVSIFFVLTLKIKYKYIMFLSLITFSTIFIVSNPRFFGFFKNISGNAENKEVKIQSATSRLFIWESAMEIASKNILFGVGAGDVKSSLIENFEIKKYDKLIKKKYNTHNEFIETFVKLGLIGLLIFISTFVFAFKNAIKQKKPLLSWFLIIIILNFLVESMLYRIAGVYFFAFFINLLIFTDYKTIKLNKYKINLKSLLSFKNIIKTITVLLIISSIISIKILTKKEEITTVYKEYPFLDKPIVRIFTNKMYKLVDKNNLWEQKMYWNLPETDKNTAIPFKNKINEHGNYKLYSLIKFYDNDSTVNPRITIKVNYTDSSFEYKSNNFIIKNGKWNYYEVQIQTDTSKILKNISGWILDHSKVDGEKHIEVKYIGLIKKHDKYLMNE